MLIQAFCKICECEIVFVLIFETLTRNNFKFANFTKHVNNQKSVILLWKDKKI